MRISLYYLYVFSEADCKSLKGISNIKIATQRRIKTVTLIQNQSKSILHEPMVNRIYTKYLIILQSSDCCQNSVN